MILIFLFVLVLIIIPIFYFFYRKRKQQKQKDQLANVQLLLSSSPLFPCSSYSDMVDCIASHLTKHYTYEQIQNMIKTNTVDTGSCSSLSCLEELYTGMNSSYPNCAKCVATKVLSDSGNNMTQAVATMQGDVSSADENCEKEKCWKPDTPTPPPNPKKDPRPQPNGGGGGPPLPIGGGGGGGGGPPPPPPGGGYICQSGSICEAQGGKFVCHSSPCPLSSYIATVLNRQID